MVFKLANKKRFVIIMLLSILILVIVIATIINFLLHLDKDDEVSNIIINQNNNNIIYDQKDNQNDNNLSTGDSTGDSQSTNNNQNYDIAIDDEETKINIVDKKNENDLNNDENKYEYGQKVPENEEVSDEYFDDAVFIGNSQIEGIQVYKAMKNATVYASKGIMVDTIYTKQVIKTSSGDRITIMDALAQNKFGKVYIMLGANELGWAYEDEFIKQYGKVIDSIKSLQPNAQIYVNAIMPVSKTKSDNDKIYNNTNVDRFNKLILEMTKEKKVYYLDSKEAMGDENGNLPEDAGPDGIHLNSTYYDKWFSYLKKHTVNIKEE